MYRDFSAKNKDKLLNLVSQVENDKICDFTDWVGDRWYDFEDWIGRLNIRNYLDNINDYHKKIIDKNNATKDAIERIFNKVNITDRTYKARLNTKWIELYLIQKYIKELCEIVNPSNGFYSGTYNEKDTNGYTSLINNLMDFVDKTGDGIYNSVLAEVLYMLISEKKDDLISWMTNEDGAIEDIQSILASKDIHGILSIVGKYGGEENATVTSKLLNYLAALCGIVTNDDASSSDIASSLLELIEASGNLETGLYNYYENKLPVFEAAKLDGKFGKTMIGLSVLTELISAANTGVDTYKIFTDPNSSIYDKSSQAINMGGSIFDVGIKSYMAVQAGDKYLRVVSSAGNNSKIVNQILMTEQSVQYTTSSAVTKNISKAATAVAVGDVAISTVASGVKRFGEVTEDGELSGADVGSVGVHASLSGLNTVTSTLTFGIVNFDSEEVAADLETEVDNYVQGDSWEAQYVRDKDNNAILRFGVSVGMGAKLVGEKVVEGVTDGIKTIGSWISTGWNYITG